MDLAYHFLADVTEQKIAQTVKMKMDVVCEESSSLKHFQSNGKFPFQTSNQFVCCQMDLVGQSAHVFYTVTRLRQWYVMRGENHQLMK